MFCVTSRECDCRIQVEWRPDDAHTAAGTQAWLPVLVRRLRQAGVRDITARLDKGFFSQAMIDTLTVLGVDFVLKVANHAYARRALAPWRQSQKGPHY